MRLSSIILAVTGILLTNVFGQNELYPPEKCFSSPSILNKTLYPGDTHIDVQYYRLNLSLDHSTQYLRGDVRIIAKMLTAGISEFFLDLSGYLTVDSVRSAGNAITYGRTAEKLLIRPIVPINAGALFDLTIYYRGHPAASGFGSFAFGTQNGTPAIWTLSEPYGAKDWFPCKDSPADKADSADIFITAASNFVSVSNGTLISVTNNPDGTRTYHWSERYPIAPYLISLAMADYELYTQYFHHNDDSMAVTHYLYRQSLPGAKDALSKTVDMLEVYSSLFGRYPFFKEKYGHAQFGWGGGMEHQTISSMGAFSESIISHELAHQWFGDMATCARWQDIWLNEGFATYCEGLYLEAKGGKEAYKSFIRRISQSARLAQGTLYIQDISSVGNIFNYAKSYAKGAVVLHLLRAELGDTIFFRSLRAYLSAPGIAYGSATTDDFRRVVENVSGRQMKYFFDQWIYGENYPTYQLYFSSFALGGGKFRAKIHLRQNANSNPSVFVSTIEFKFSGDYGRDTTIAAVMTAIDSEFIFDIGFEPKGFSFDPDEKLLKDVIIFNAPVDLLSSSTAVLMDNFPNPFTNETTIGFFLPHEEFITLRLFDLSGALVKDIFAGRFGQGIYTKKISAVELASGVYFVRLSSPRWQRLKKIIVLH